VDGVTGTYRLYVSTVGSYRQGDFLYNDNGTWKWIDSADGSYKTTRVGYTPMTLDLTGQPDPYDQTESLSTPITMPSNPTGYYKIKVTFDVTDCFFWDDNDDDGLFEPAGHDWQQNVNALDGSGFNFWPGPPAETWAVEHVT
ncbi:MAG: hypothetical protein ABID54_07295, partial [Pseudomonadota bacterium]